MIRKAKRFGAAPVAMKRESFHRLWCACQNALLYKPGFGKRERHQSGKNSSPLRTRDAFNHGRGLWLQSAGYKPNELTTEAAITLISEGQGFRISRSLCRCAASVPKHP